MKNHIFVLFSIVLITVNGAQDDPQISAVKGLISRLIPQWNDVFELSLVSNPNNNDLDYFEIESVNTNKIALRGTSGVALASALNYYLKYKCSCSVSWLGDNLNLPSTPPTVSPKITKDSPLQYRYYMNTCTFGYSAAFWNWNRWEREIDWMALNGLNMPLSFVGQEYVWSQLFLNMGLSSEDLHEFFTGPAFLPWQRMGNVNGWAGPLPDSWMEKQRDLQLKILTRQRSFGMTPILPGFAGHVPGALKSKFPSANITQLDGWTIFNGTYFLDPLDPLFQTIGSQFIKIQTQVYGTDHLYNADPFNEENPPTNDVTYLGHVSSAISSAMKSGDAKATWVLQGWFLYSSRTFWQPPQAKAFLTAVKDLIVLDLWAEVFPVWNLTDGFYGQKFIWCMLHNFGGRNGLYGTLPRVNQGPYDALKAYGSNMVGIGITPEGINTNPILYDLITDSVWRDAPVPNMDDWVQGYVLRRYGSVPAGASSAFKKLQDSVWWCTTQQAGTTDSIIALRPEVQMSTWNFYNASYVQSAWKDLFSARSSLSALETYQTDLVDVTMQALNDYMFTLFLELKQAHNSNSASGVHNAATKILDLLTDVNKLLHSSKHYLLGSWIDDATQWATNENEKKLYEMNARTQITLWGPKTSTLHDYAYKLWEGLVGDFYYGRWKLFLTELEKSVKNSVPFDSTKYENDVENFEESWTLSNNRYPKEPSGDTIQIVGSLLSKYGK